MQFLYPGFLWALTALSIPIILHLFYFRRYKKVYFSNLRFLREVKEETSTRNRLRNLLILLARLLALAFLILAFTQPYLPLGAKATQGIRNISLFMDNSFSMQSFGKDLSLFDRGRQKAREIIMGYNPEDRFNVMGHGLTSGEQQWVSRDEALLRLEEMELTPDVKSLSVIANRQKQLEAKEEGVPVSWIISDFQASIMDLHSSDSTHELNLLPLHGVQEKNVAIDSAWFESPVIAINQASALLFTLRNYAPEASDNIRVTIELDGQERPEATVDLNGHSTYTDTANITVLQTGWHNIAIRISDYPVTFDDTYFLSFYVDEFLKVLCINEGVQNKKMAAIFKEKENFIYTQAESNALQYAEFPEYNLIILNELRQIPSGLSAALRRYVDEGGKVLFIPHKDGALEGYNALLSTMEARSFNGWSDQERQAGTINTDAFIYRDVFARKRPNMRLPKVTGSFTSPAGGRSGQSILGFRDGGDLITFYTPGEGGFCALSSPLDESINDLSLQPEIFVPLLYKLTIYTSRDRKLAYTIGTDHLIPLDRSKVDINQDIEITGPSTFKPGLSPLGNTLLLDVQGQIATSGFYAVQQGQQTVAQLAFNYDRKESDLTLAPVESFPDQPGIKVWSVNDEADFTHLIESTRHGKALWKWCLILSLLFIGAEIGLIRLWKYN